MRKFAILGFAFALAACIDPGARHKANVYQTDQLNQRQEVKGITILAVQAARVQVDNTHNQNLAGGVGAIFGSIFGAKIGNDGVGGTAGAVLGGAVGKTAGELIEGGDVLLNGVQITYNEGGRILNSTQLGMPCEFALGVALAIVTKSNETRIQSNHDCVEGREAVLGSVSKLAHVSATLLGAGATDQDALDALNREAELTRKKQEVQKARTGLAKESSRTKQAERAVDAEIKTHENKNEVLLRRSQNTTKTIAATE